MSFYQNSILTCRSLPPTPLSNNSFIRWRISSFLNPWGVQEILRLFSCLQKIIQSRTSWTSSLLPTLVLFSHPYLCCQSGLFYSGFRTNNLNASLITSLYYSCPCSHTLPDLMSWTQAEVTKEKAKLTLIPILLSYYFHRLISCILYFLMFPTVTGKNNFNNLR